MTDGLLERNKETLSPDELMREHGGKQSIDILEAIFDQNNEPFEDDALIAFIEKN